MKTSPASKLSQPQDYASARSLGGATSEWPSNDWWTAYGDPQLTTLIETALTRPASADAA